MDENEKLKAGYPDLIPIRFEKICYVSGTDIKNILGWFMGDIVRSKHLPLNLDEKLDFDFLYRAYPQNMVLQDPLTLQVNGMVDMYLTNDDRTLKSIGKCTGTELDLLITCLRIIETPISKIEVTVKCHGVDAANAITSYVDTLFERFVKVFDAQPYPSLPAANQGGTEEWKPWLHIPDEKENRKIIQLWCEGRNAKEIAQEVFMKAETIHNIISGLRNDHPEARIPKDRERKSMRF